ncbi:MAG: hypothetical protein ACJ8J0_06835 [Longimicrobiaceae bacterium]
MRAVSPRGTSASAASTPAHPCAAGACARSRSSAATPWSTRPVRRSTSP